MQYFYQRLRFHFVEHAAKQVWQNSDVTTAVMNSLRQELDQELTADQTQALTDQVQLLCSEADKLVRSHVPHDCPSRSRSIELWGYEHIQPLHPDIYIHHEQPSQNDFNHHFALPEGEVWPWNVIYTYSGAYYGVQASASGQPATCAVDLGALDFVLQTAAVLKTFPGCELLGDLTVENIDTFTLEADESKAMLQTMQEKEQAIGEALSELIQGDRPQAHGRDVLTAWQRPLQAAQQGGMAQFKSGKLIQTVEYSEAKG